MAELVASGEAEIGMQQIVAILPVKGAELVGPLPSELQNSSSMPPDLRRAAEPARGARLHRVHGTPEAVRIIRAKGMEPG